MAKKKSKKRALAFTHSTATGNGPTAPPGSGDTFEDVGARSPAPALVSVPELSGIERLLPRLILFPSEGGRLSSSERRALDRCVRLCEDLLALKPEVERVERLTSLVAAGAAGLGATPGARGEADGTPRGASCASAKEGTLAAAVEEAAATGGTRGALEQALHERRVALADSFERAIPRDLQEWISSWDHKIDAQVGEEYLRWLADGSALLQAQAREWVEAVARVKPGSLGLLSRVRALRLAGRAKAAEREATRLRRETALRRARLAQSHARAARLCGILAAFLKTTTCPPGGDARLVRKLLLLDLERALGGEIRSEISLRERTIAESRAARSRSGRRHDALRRYVADLEARKNLRLVELYAGSGANVREAIPAATVRQVDAAFGELREAEARWASAAEDEAARVRALKRELERLSGVVDDYARRYFADGLCGPGPDPVEGPARSPEVPGAPVVRASRLVGRAQ